MYTHCSDRDSTLSSINKLVIIFKEYVSNKFQCVNLSVFFSKNLGIWYWYSTGVPTLKIEVRGYLGCSTMCHNSESTYFKIGFQDFQDSTRTNIITLQVKQKLFCQRAPKMLIQSFPFLINLTATSISTFKTDSLKVNILV